MGIKITLDMQAIKMLEDEAKKSAELAMEQLKGDLINSQTMPRDNGDMQNNQTFVAVEGDCTRLVTGSPQARRLYYHPEYKFQKGKNKHAGAKWLEPYISGDKKDFVRDAFVEIYKKRTGV